MTKFAPYAKACIGALVGALAALSQALDDGGVSAQEWVGVTIALLGGLGLVFAVPNKDPNAAHQDESVQPPTLGKLPPARRPYEEPNTEGR
jgi:peptidoglycan/LPS O-acetylase OafA/YrhL